MIGRSGIVKSLTGVRGNANKAKFIDFNVDHVVCLDQLGTRDEAEGDDDEEEEDDEEVRDEEEEDEEEGEEEESLESNLME